MTQVRIAASAKDLSTAHAMAVVVVRMDVLRRDRLEKTRPARPRMELRVGCEQGQAAASARVKPLALVVQERPTEGMLRAFAAGNAVLLGRELRAPLRVRLVDVRDFNRS